MELYLLAFDHMVITLVKDSGWAYPVVKKYEAEASHDSSFFVLNDSDVFYSAEGREVLS